VVRVFGGVGVVGGPTAGLAEYMLSNGDEPDCCIPVEGACPGSGCDKTLLWGDLIKATLQR